ncbi:hypothetical protein EQV77_06675 [Halobacillus fulvus]|nr:hypothetical protein EQV77_06675 [Halobacillus fulvus]
MKKVFSMSGFGLFLTSILPYIADATPIGGEVFEFYLDIGLFLPLVLSITGGVLSLFGLKGQTKWVLVILNIGSCAIWAFTLFVAMYGF